MYYDRLKQRVRDYSKARQAADLPRVSVLDCVAPCYHDIHSDVVTGTHTIFHLPGGRGSGKSSFVSLEIVDGGIPLVNILQTSMNNAMVIVSARGKDPLTQKGARVGIWSVGFGQLAFCMSNKEHLDYNWVRFAQNVNLFVSGALDATLAMSYNEYYQLMQAGVEMTEGNVYRFCDHGYNVQEDGVYMMRDYYKSHKEQARRFARASKKGWLWAAQHQEETLDIVMRYVEKAHIATNRTMQRLMLQEILRLQVNRETKKREFRLLPDMVQKASHLMKENGMLKREVTYEELTRGLNE